MAMTEQQTRLVETAQGGDVGSFEQLYAIYYEKVYGFARMIVKNESDAEDILQETFITAWRKLGTLESPAAFCVWLQIIAKNLCNMQLRRKDMVLLLDADQEIEDFYTEESEEYLPAVYAERSDLRERLGRIIDGLSEVQRQTVVLYYFNELSVEEIANVMECSPGTVKSRLFLARKTIKTEIEEQERRTGERFYGIVGIPMLSLGKLVQSHMKTLAINQSAASASLSAITDSISNPSAGGAASKAARADSGGRGARADSSVRPAAEAQKTASKAARADSGGGGATKAARAANAETEIAATKVAKAAIEAATRYKKTNAKSNSGKAGAGKAKKAAKKAGKAAKKLSSKAKIAISVATVAVVGAAATLAVILAVGVDKSNLPNGGQTPGASISASSETPWLGGETPEPAPNPEDSRQSAAPENTSQPDGTSTPAPVSVPPTDGDQTTTPDETSEPGNTLTPTPAQPANSKPPSTPGETSRPGDPSASASSPAPSATPPDSRPPNVSDESQNPGDTTSPTPATSATPPDSSRPAESSETPKSSETPTSTPTPTSSNKPAESSETPKPSESSPPSNRPSAPIETPRPGYPPIYPPTPTQSYTPPPPEETPEPSPPSDPPEIYIDSELLGAIANLPRSDALDILWRRLQGYWYAMDSQFVGFLFSGNSHSVDIGYIYADWRYIGIIAEATPIAPYVAMLVIHVPAQEQSQGAPPDTHEETWYEMYIDVSNLPVNGKIDIKTEKLSGEWHQYTRGGGNLP